MTLMVAEFGVIDLLEGESGPSPGPGSSRRDAAIVAQRARRASVPESRRRSRSRGGRRWEIKLTLTGKMPRPHHATITIETTTSTQCFTLQALRGTVSDSVQVAPS